MPHILFLKIASLLFFTQPIDNQRLVSAKEHFPTNCAAPTHPVFPYKLDEPDLTFDMPDNLHEISGLSITPEGSLAAVDDEKGVIFLINKNTGAIEREINFWEDGDYEGLEIVGNDAYAVKSSGSLYHIKNYRSDNRETIKIKSFLNKENDVEGLAYDPKKNTLLLGCKGKGVDGEGNELKKAVYAFDLASQTMAEKPAFLLTMGDIHHYLGHCQDKTDLDKLQEYFSLETKEMKFNPSGIAVHPLSGDVYITSSTGKMLLVFSPAGEILFLKKLKKSIHPQPEGLCFDKDGTLYISNEGKDDSPGKIYKFRFRK